LSSCRLSSCRLSSCRLSSCRLSSCRLSSSRLSSSRLLTSRSAEPCGVARTLRLGQNPATSPCLGNTKAPYVLRD
ncbi:MAG: pentapeptide repeat-containing protein, partial [Planctomycetota bacterium]